MIYDSSRFKVFKKSIIQSHKGHDSLGDKQITISRYIWLFFINIFILFSEEQRELQTRSLLDFNISLLAEPVGSNWSFYEMLIWQKGKEEEISWRWNCV